MQKHLFILLAWLIPCCLAAQPTEKLVKVNVAPDHADWAYKKGEQANFRVTVTKNNVPLLNAKVKYEIGPELMPTTIKDSAILKDGTLFINGITATEAGFYRCKVWTEYDGVKYENIATAAYNPESIQPTIPYPSDFTEFWDKAKQELAKIPMDVKLTLLPERCTERTNVYQANIQNFRLGSRLYGIVCIPKKPGKYPALLRVPGAGVRPYQGDVATADLGFITFEIGIHGIPVTMDLGVYNDLKDGALNGYYFYNLDDREKYYYKRVYMGCIRAVDFLYSLPEFDGANLGVWGGSQGGALSIVTAALDSRVKCLVAYHPALCDLSGFLSNRAGGWPQMFREKKTARPEQIETMKYYDVVNFAKNLKTPGYYAWGYNDGVCAPTSMHAAYNVINAPKELHVVQDNGHWAYPEQYEKSKQWLLNKLQPTKKK